MEGLFRRGAQATEFSQLLAAVVLSPQKDNSWDAVMSFLEENREELYDALTRLADVMRAVVRGPAGQVRIVVPTVHDKSEMWDHTLHAAARVITAIQLFFGREDYRTFYRIWLGRLLERPDINVFLIEYDDRPTLVVRWGQDEVPMSLREIMGMIGRR
jgi:aspartate/methionine/tyrosine aminotransferase